MTEEEWLTSREPSRMIQFLEAGKNTANGRKLRLFCVACVDRVLGALSSEKARNAVRAAESYADGVVTATALKSACQDAAEELLVFDVERDLFPTKDNTLAKQALDAAIWVANERRALAHAAVRAIAASADRAAEQLAQCGLLREVFGNPLCLATCNPSWRTSDVILLANGIYSEKAFDRMPILADALQDAGCDNEDILSHCRGAGAHVRGCWVVDLVLGKE